MSVQIAFQNIVLTRRNTLLSAEKQLQVFQIDVYNNRMKESIKFTIQIDGDAQDKKIQFPKNMFILPSTQKLTVRIDEKNQSHKKYGELSFGQRILEFDQFRNRETELKTNNMKVFQQSLQFDTKDSFFKVLVKYKARLESSKIFSGHFNGILNHQQQNNQIVFRNNDNKKNRMKGEESDLKSQQETQYKTQNFEVQFDGDEQILDQDLEHNFSSNVLHNSLFPKKMKDLSKASTEDKKQNKKIETGIKEAELGYDKKNKRKDITPVTFYSGPCRTKNLFSCLDQKVDQQEITFIEPVYKD